MRAVAVRRFREPPELMELPTPVPGPRELRVQVEYAGINPFDWKIADGILEGHRPHVFPLVLGVDAAGRVEETGSDVHRFRRGDRVAGQFLHDPVGTGTYAELALVPEGIGVVRIPDELPMAEAAALPTAGMTALAALDTLELGPGGTLMIVGASGGVGSFATEIAAARGVRVTAVARPSSAERLRALGATNVVDIATVGSLPSLSRSSEKGFDGLLDTMSDTATLGRLGTQLRPGGTLVSTVYAGDISALTATGVRAVNLDLQPNASLMERLVREIVDHHLSIPLERTVPLPQASASLAELRAGRGHGKTVIDLRP